MRTAIKLILLNLLIAQIIAPILVMIPCVIYLVATTGNLDKDTLITMLMIPAQLAGQLMMGIYLCTLLLFLSARLRNLEGLSLLALVFWAALCFLVTVLPFDRLLQLCSTAAYAALAVIGLILYGILIFNVQRRREHYDMAHIG